ncbi:MAG: hypothetical protein JEY71_04795 [Sphaerochaeta sp.]|nr:hypothetical protein [Sphaerochaeta sp.]
MSYTINYTKEIEAIKGQTTARLIRIHPTNTSDDQKGLPLRTRLLGSDFMQLILTTDQRRIIHKTLRVTPERVDYYLAAIGQTFEITIGGSKRV